MSEDFSEAWEHCGEALRRYVAHSVRSPTDAADILSDIALKGLENWHKLRDKRSACAWLFSIARNTVRNYYKSHHHRFSRALEAQDIEALIREYDRIDFDRMVVREFLSRLDDAWATVVTLSLYHGYSYPEIARMTGFSRATIARRMPVIIARLAAAVYPPDEEDS